MIAHPEVFVELVEHETHTIHEAVHVRRFALFVARVTVRSQRYLERFEILHPFYRKIMGLHVGLVEDENKREFGLIQDTECVPFPSEFFRAGANRVSYLQA